MNAATPLTAGIALPLIAMLALAGCGGGKVETVGPVEPPVYREPPIPDQPRRTRILAGNRSRIEAAVDENINSKDTDWRDVSYDWNGSELRFAIHEDGVSSPTAVLLSSAHDTVEMFEMPALSGTNIQSRTRREFKIGQSVGTKDTIGRIGVDYQSDSDYFVYGYWLTVDHGQDDAESLTSVTVDTGAFSSAFVARTSVPSTLSGTATYRGIKQASGLHTVTYSGVADSEERRFSGGYKEFRIAHFEADIELTANFAAGEIGGIDSQGIESKIDNIFYPSPEENSSGPVFLPNGRTTGGRRLFEVVLGAARIDSSGHFSGGAETGTTSAWNGPTWEIKRPTIVESSGYWEGQFSSRAVSQSNSQPRAAAGTFATTYTFSDGTVGKYIGTFSAGHCSDPSC